MKRHGRPRRPLGPDEIYAKRLEALAGHRIGCIRLSWDGAPASDGPRYGLLIEGFASEAEVLKFGQELFDSEFGQDEEGGHVRFERA